MSTTPSSATTPTTYEQIAIRAYELWEARGCPEGSSEEDWFAAEAELTTPAKTAVAGSSL